MAANAFVRARIDEDLKNQAADVLALLEHHLSRLGVEVRTG